MFALINRGILPATTEDEFEHFIVRLKALWLTEHNEDGTHAIPTISLASATVPIGAITGWPTNTAPVSWLLCDASAISRTIYSELFAVIAVLYGAGDGSTTFNVPDARQRFILGKAASGTADTLNDTGGAIDHSHTVDGHVHTNPTTGAPSATQVVQAGTGVTVTSSTHTHDQDDTGSAGPGSSTNNPPYLVLNYIISTGVVA